jgi:hypothetical protein
MAVQVATRALSTDPLPILAALQFLLLAAALLLLYAWLSPIAGPTVALLLCLLASFERTFAHVLTSGMETHLAFVCLLFVLLLLRAGSLGARLQVALVLLFFARLDGGLLWVALAVALLRERGVRAVFRLFAAPALVALAYLAFNALVFGTAMPISGRVKAVALTRLSDLIPGFDRLLLLFVPQSFDWPGRLSPWAPLQSPTSTALWILYLGGVLFAIVLLLRSSVRKGTLDLSLKTLAGYVLLHTAYYAVLQRDRYALSWARGPELLLLVTCLGWMLSRLPRPAGSAAADRVSRLATAAAALLLFAFMWSHLRYEARHAGTIRDYTTSISQFGEGVQWIRAHTGEREVIASESIGFLGWFSDRRIVSLDGLLNSLDYYRSYLLPRRPGAYLREHGVRYVAQALRKDVEPLGYMSDVLGVPVQALRIAASFEGTARNPRRYLVIELVRGPS